MNSSKFETEECLTSNWAITTNYKKFYGKETDAHDSRIRFSLYSLTAERQSGTKEDKILPSN